MKIIKTKWFPFGQYSTINLFGILFCRRIPNKIDINHETIHTKQGQELLWIGFYLWYVLEYLIRLIIYRNTKLAYKNISFEREAYQNQDDLDYLSNRKHYNWFSYIKKI